MHREAMGGGGGGGAQEHRSLELLLLFVCIVYVFGHRQYKKK